MVEHVDLDCFADYVFFQLIQTNGTVLFANQCQQIVVVLFNLVVVFLFSGIEEDPDVEVFALGFFDALDETVGGEGFEDFVDHDWGVVGSFLDVIFGGGMLLDEVVDPSIVLGQNSGEDSVDALFLLLGLCLHGI